MVVLIALFFVHNRKRATAITSAAARKVAASNRRPAKQWHYPDVMPSKKRILAQLLSATGMAQALVRLRALAKSELTILAYHRVLDRWDEASFDFDLELISASVEEFAWQMRYVRDRYAPITFAQLIAHLDGATPLPKRPLLVTFDDGFDDNYHHAFPVLKGLGMPATIFLSTGYIGGVRTFWYDWLCYLCNRLAAAGRPGITFAGKDFSLAADPRLRRDGIDALFAHVKRLPDTTLRAELERVEHESGIDYPALGFALSRPLQWDQVREMARAGIEFGSHAVTHPILTNLTAGQLAEELRGPREALQREISQATEVIAYPVGEDFAFSETVVEAAKAAGYRLGASYISGVNRLDALDRFGLKRLHVERYTSRADFRAMLALPGLLA